MTAKYSRRQVLKSALAGALGVVLVTIPKAVMALVPFTLSSGTITQTSIATSWTDADNEQSYRVFRNNALITTLGANVHSFTHTNLTPNTTYSLRVDAKKGGQTISSNTISRTTLAATQPPTITSFNPTEGPVGQAVSIFGTNFTGATLVEFDGTNQTNLTVVSPTRIDTTVPDDPQNPAATGFIEVHTPAGTAISPTVFTVTTPQGGNEDIYQDSYGVYA